VKLPAFLRGTPQVFRQELFASVKSVRFLIMALVSALVIVGGSYGISGLGGGFGPPPLVVWLHPIVDTNGDHIAVAWAADPFGAPVAQGTIVSFEDLNTSTTLGEVPTDSNGFARLNVGTAPVVAAMVRLGNIPAASITQWGSPPPVDFFFLVNQNDLDQDGGYDDLSMQVVDLTGAPVAGRVLLNATEVATLNPNTGFAWFSLPPGESNVTLEVAGEPPLSQTMYVGDSGGATFLSGPDFVLLIIATLSTLFISIFAITITFDSVSKERVQGTMDLLLSRPVSRTGVLLGKFLASFAAVAIPVTLVNLAGIGVISAASGKAPTGSFAAAFVGYSLLLIAFYVLLQLTMSTLAKTGGTAVLFGVLIWLLLNILYSIVTLVVASVFSGGDPATFFRIQQYAALGNPSAVVGNLISLSAPVDLGFFGGGTTLDAGLFAGAAVFWFVSLFLLALWTFQKKAAE